MQKRVIIFTSASCTGWAFTYDADDHQQDGVKALADRYNTTEAWRARNNDGSVEVFDSVDAAVTQHNRERTEVDDEDHVGDINDLLGMYALDGQGCPSSLGKVLIALVSNPMDDQDIWPPVEMAG